MLSPDPNTWEGDYIAANGTAMFRGGEFLYWYHSGPQELPRLGLARSQDGRHWTKSPHPVLEPGPRGSWDERGVADPYVLYAKGAYYLFYLGQDRARRQRLGVARSTDGASWQKLRANPVLELGGLDAFDENGLGEPAVWIGYGAYWMLYTGRDHAENRRIGLARSPRRRYLGKVAGSVRGAVRVEQQGGLRSVPSKWWAIGWRCGSAAETWPPRTRICTGRSVWGCSRRSVLR